MSIWIVLKNLTKKNYLLENVLIWENIVNDGEISDGHVSVKDYLTFEKIWDNFGRKNMGNYHDDYFKKDVLLLADVFEKFVDTCLKYCGLYPSHYFSSSGLS